MKFEPKGTLITPERYAEGQKDVFENIEKIFSQPCFFKFLGSTDVNDFIFHRCLYVGIVSAANEIKEINRRASSAMELYRYDDQFDILYLPIGDPERHGSKASIVTPDSQSAALLRLLDVDNIFGPPTQLKRPLKMTPYVKGEFVQPGGTFRRDMATSIPTKNNPYRPLSK